MTADDVLTFWFEELKPSQWFNASKALDQSISEHFSDLLQQAKACELADWRMHPLGRLAEIIVLDQFSRNIYRGQAKAFAQDAQALTLAQEAIAHGANEKLQPEARAFLYMPFMHSESLLIQKISLSLFKEQGLENSLKFAQEHFDTIKRFGRFPYRNQALGRDSTASELAFLQGK